MWFEAHAFGRVPHALRDSRQEAQSSASRAPPFVDDKQDRLSSSYVAPENRNSPSTIESYSYAGLIEFEQSRKLEHSAGSESGRVAFSHSHCAKSQESFPPI